MTRVKDSVALPENDPFFVHLHNSNFHDCIVQMELQAPAQQHFLAFSHGSIQTLASYFSYLRWKFKKGG